MSNGKPDPQRSKLINDILEADKRHKAAVKWLMDINTFFNLFGHDDNTWKGTTWAELARVAATDKEEAIQDVIKTRKELEAARKRLDLGDFDGHF